MIWVTNYVFSLVKAVGYGVNLSKGHHWGR